MPARGGLSRDLAIDLGTANVVVYARGRGVVVDEPAVVAVDRRREAVIAVGREAKRMTGRTPPAIDTVRPLRGGVIADIENTERLLRELIGRAHAGRRLGKPRLVVAVPSGLTGVERRAVQDCCAAAGARAVHLVEEPLAAAIGAGLPVQEPFGSMVVDVGGGTTETAIISLGGMVSTNSARVGGDQLDAAVVAHLRKEYSLTIGDTTAEELKIAAGSAFPGGEPRSCDVRGRDLVSGLPRTVTVTGEEVRAAIGDPVAEIVDTVTLTLDTCPPELAGDVMDRGITLTGGGALLRGLDERLRHETRLPVHLVELPLLTVAEGVGRCVEDFDAFEAVLSAQG